jgi:hypothetical protein
MITINMIAIVMHPLQDKTEKEKYSTHGGAGMSCHTLRGPTLMRVYLYKNNINNTSYVKYHTDNKLS